MTLRMPAVSTQPVAAQTGDQEVGTPVPAGSGDQSAANLKEPRPVIERDRPLSRSALFMAAFSGAAVVATKAALPGAAQAAGSSSASSSSVGVLLAPNAGPDQLPAPVVASKAWDKWDQILNPDHLPIYHDTFDQIPASHPKHHWVMVIDLRRCIGCQACVVSCKSENRVPVGSFRTFVDVAQIGETVATPDGNVVTEEGIYQQQIKVLNIPKLCNHCDDPPCVEVCPVAATFKRQDGIVLVDPTLCIGCGACVNACPYDARFINPISNTADKCTFCVERVDQGLLPACVTTCVGHARIFGDLNDPLSEVSQLIADNQVEVRKPSMGTDPQVFYIGLDGTLSILDDPDLEHLVYTYTMNTNSTAYEQLTGKISSAV